MDFEQQVKEAGRPTDWGAPFADVSLVDWIVGAVCLAILLAAIGWGLRAYFRWEWKGCRSRRVWLVQAAFWASTNRSLVPRVGYQEHEWSILGGEYAAEFMVCYSGSGSGKSSRLVIPLIVRRLRRRRVSLVVMDPKGEQYRWSWPWLGAVAGYPPMHLLSTLPRHKRGSVPIDVFATPTMRRRFLRGVFGAQDAKESFWLEGAVEMWDEVADALGDADLITTWLALRDPARLDELAERCEGVRGVWAGSHTKGSHQDIRTNAVVPFTALKEERVRRLFDRGRLPTGSAGGPTFSEREIVYICVTDDDKKTSGALFAGLVAELQHRAVDRREGAPNVEIVADEAGTCYPLRELEDYIQMCRGAGVNIALFLQSYSQAVSKLGVEAADDVMGVAELQIFGPTMNVATRRRLEELSGTAYLPQPGRDEPTLQPIVRGDLLGKIRKGTFYVIHSGRRPERVTQRARWPQIERLILPARAKRGKPNLVSPPKPAPERPRPRRQDDAGGGAGDRKRPEPRSSSASNFSRPPDTGSDHRRRLQEERQADREFAREEAMRLQRDAGAASPESEPTVPKFVPRGSVPNLRRRAPERRRAHAAPTDPPPETPTVPNLRRKGPYPLEIRNGRVTGVCPFCEHPNPAAAETCENGNCGTALA